MYPALKLVAKFRFLRGTAFDPIGLTQERKAERALISDYKETVFKLLSELNEKNFPIALEIARLPDQIRGYGPVKEQAIQESRDRQKDLLQRFSDPDACVVKIVEVA